MELFDWWTDTVDPEASGKGFQHKSVFAVFGKRTTGGSLGKVSAPETPLPGSRPFRPTRAAMVSREPASARAV